MHCKQPLYVSTGAGDTMSCLSAHLIHAFIDDLCNTVTEYAVLCPTFVWGLWNRSKSTQEGHCLVSLWLCCSSCQEEHSGDFFASCLGSPWLSLELLQS